MTCVERVLTATLHLCTTRILYELLVSDDLMCVQPPIEVDLSRGRST